MSVFKRWCPRDDTDGSQALSDRAGFDKECGEPCSESDVSGIICEGEGNLSWCPR